MIPGHGYGSNDPTIKCPYCGSDCHADFTDVGVGYQQTGPYGCDLCHAVEMSADELYRSGTLGEHKEECKNSEEKRLGWYKPEYRFSHEFPPIPDRTHDWRCWRSEDNDNEESRPEGWGKTKEKALTNLLNSLEDDP
jgi:hypothetical protein